MHFREQDEFKTNNFKVGDLVSVYGPLSCGTEGGPIFGHDSKFTGGRDVFIVCEVKRNNLRVRLEIPKDGVLYNKNFTHGYAHFRQCRLLTPDKPREWVGTCSATSDENPNVSGTITKWSGPKLKPGEEVKVREVIE